MTAQELKNSILQLAVQGKLVPQCKEDEPASELTRQIIKSRNQVKKNLIKTLSSISEEEISFDIPESWIWLRLGDFCQVYNGNSINSTVKQKKYSQKCDGHCFIATKDLGFDHIVDYENGIYIPKEETNFKVANAGSILLCMEGGSAGKKIGVLDRDVCFGNKLCCFTPYIIDNQYLYYYLQSPVFFSAFFSSMTGLIGGVGSAKLKKLICPIPPLAEQKRIVAKIEELMPLIEEYGKAEEQLTKVNAEFSDKLRKSILQQAVQGKLTERDPSDEPASELIKRIKTEKEALIKSGKIKKEKLLPAITDDEKPYYIPDTWEWVRLSNASVGQITYGIIKLGEEDSEGVKVLRCSDIKPGYIVTSNIRTVKKALSEEYVRTILNGGEIVINVRGTLGGCAVVPIELKGYNVAREVAVIPISKLISNKYLMYILLSPIFDSYLIENLRGVAYKGLNIELLSDFPIPLPPIAEQKRIVKRVEELLALCDGLKGC